MGVPMGLRNRGDINDVGVHAVDDFASFDAGLGDRCPVGVCISGVDTPRGVAGMDMSSVSGLSSILTGFTLPKERPGAERSDSCLGLEIEVYGPGRQ